MNPMVCLFALFATSMAAPVSKPESFYAGLPAVGHAAYAGVPALGHAAAPYALAAAPAIAAAPIAAAPAISVPAPYTTSHVSGPDAVSVHVPEPVITKKIEYGTRPYIAAYDTIVHKPLLGDLDIAVPTALLGTTSQNAPITRVSKEPFIVNEPVPVEKPYNVPYDVIKNVVRTVEVPTPVHVDAPYNVPVPTPVQGAPIIQKVQGPPQVIHTHENRVAPAVHTGHVGLVRGTYAHGALAHGHLLGGHIAAPVAAVH